MLAPINAETDMTPSIHLTAGCLAALASVAAPPALAQDYQAMIQQSMGRMNTIVAQAQNRVQGAVTQRMQDPAVQAAWQQYVARNGGRSLGFQNTGIFSNSAGSPDSVASPTSMPL